MLYRALLLLALATAHAWNECAFPDVGYYAVDEGLGLSFAYGAAGMNGELPQPRGAGRLPSQSGPSPFETTSCLPPLPPTTGVFPLKAAQPACR